MGNCGEEEKEEEDKERRRRRRRWNKHLDRRPSRMDGLGVALLRPLYVHELSDCDVVARKPLGKARVGTLAHIPGNMQGNHRRGPYDASHTCGYI